jgi:signal transduction histidine kinase
MVPQPLSELEDRAHSIRNQAYGTLFAGVALAMLLAWLITSRVTRPLSEVLAAARRLSVGKIDTRVDVPGRWTPRETRELATGFNQMATALQRSHEYLERNVERRTKQLQRSEQQLRKAKEVAESANKAKSTFLAQMSHELRTPLNAILGYSEIMSREMFGPIGSAKYREYLKHVHESGSHLRDVIGDILDASKLEDGGMVLVTENVPITDIVDAALVHTAPAAQQRDMRIFKLLPSDSPELHVDKTRMVQVLTNIVANAVKFTLSGGAIFVAAGVACDGTIKFKIRDTGVGIPENDLSRISEPFQQSENGFKCTTEGAGLGVTIATTLARLHGGELVVRSSIACGTFITVSLPATCIASNVMAVENDVGDGVNPQRSATQKLQPAVPAPTIP